MLPVHVLLVGESLDLFRRLRAPLEAEGMDVSLGSAGPSPGILLARAGPDLLIAEFPGRHSRIEAWRRAIESFRMRRPLAVLAIAPRILSVDEQRILDEIADLGVLRRRPPWEEIVARVEDWYADQTPCLKAG